MTVHQISGFDELGSRSPRTETKKKNPPPNIHLVPSPKSSPNHLNKTLTIVPSPKSSRSIVPKIPKSRSIVPSKTPKSVSFFALNSRLSVSIPPLSRYLWSRRHSRVSPSRRGGLRHRLSTLSLSQSRRLLLGDGSLNILFMTDSSETPPTVNELYLHLHTVNHDGMTFIDTRSERFYAPDETSGGDPCYTDQSVDDKAVYLKAAGECPEGRVYGLGSLGRKKRRYARSWKIRDGLATEFKHSVAIPSLIFQEYMHESQTESETESETDFCIPSLIPFVISNGIRDGIHEFLISVSDSVSD
ncbi:hypothetical protein Scep_021924 [Stephania cephalantha]|uniref:Uncharacterized protein n=1 Tax=Stephania cephalantha TaxID=152367 RepID=A0AAP0F6Y2_9MAGN